MKSKKYTHEGLEDYVESLDDKLSDIDKRLDSIDVTLVRNTVSLEEHMARSKSNELAIEELKNNITPVLIKFNLFAKLILALVTSGALWTVVQKLLTL